MVFLPLNDDTRLRFISWQVVTLLLIVANVLVYLAGLIWETDLLPLLMQGAAVPAQILGAVPPPDGQWLPPQATLVTSAFLHAGFWHLAGNMVFFQVFGDNVEDAMGHGRYLVFYLAVAALATLAHALMEPTSTTPLVGASGAISGVLGAYVLLYPRARILTLVLRFEVTLPAWLLVFLWTLFQIGAAAFMTDSNTAWFAHLGGFFAGMLLVWPFKRGVVGFNNPPEGA